MIDLEYSEDLTPQQFKVFELWAMGYTAKQIAVELSNSMRTIESHIKSAYGKTGCQNRADAFKMFYPIWMEREIDRMEQENGLKRQTISFDVAAFRSRDRRFDCAGSVSLSGFGAASGAGGGLLD